MIRIVFWAFMDPLGTFRVCSEGRHGVWVYVGCLGQGLVFVRVLGSKLGFFCLRFAVLNLHWVQCLRRTAEARKAHNKRVL